MLGPIATGRVVVVTGGATGPGRALASGLSDRGATVAVVDAASFASRDAAETALADAAAPLGPMAAVVHPVLDVGGFASRTLADTDEREWDTRAEGVLRTSLFCAQAAFGHLREQAGSLVFVVPSLSMVGAAGYVPYLTATEGVRALAKSAARQWGKHGVTVVCVAPSAVVMWPDGDDVPPAPDPPALGRHPELTAEVADVVALLVDGPAPALTGTTLTADGGQVMLP